MNNRKNKQIKVKNAITTILAVPAVILLVGENSLLWTNLLGAGILLAVMAGHGLLQRERYDENGWSLRER